MEQLKDNWLLRGWQLAYTRFQSTVHQLLVSEPGASRGNFLLKLWDLSGDVYYMLPNKKKTCWHFGNLPEAKWRPFFKMATFS